MSTSVESFEVGVIGLGALGSAAAYYLARRGVSVAAFEQFGLGHVRGASHDTSRIIRRTYHAPQYVKLADSAYRDWRELETVTQERLVTVTGGVVLCPPDGPVSVEDYAGSLGAGDVPFDVLDHRELCARWPQLRAPEGILGVVQADTGIVPASRTTALLQFLARAHGAVLRAECPVQALEPMDDGVELRTAAGRVRVGRVIVCADAWTSKLLAPLGAALRLSYSLEQVSYYQPKQPEKFAHPEFPVWIWAGNPSYYGFPTYGESTIKAARDASGIDLDVDNRSFEPHTARLAELSTFMNELIPAKGTHLRTVTCQYTLTPDRDFALGPLPQHPDIFVALGAGHAFKFAPTIGRILAELATSASTTDDISLFDLDRPSLRQA